MQLSGAVLAITPFTIGEMTYGALNRNWSAERIRKLDNHLQAFQVVPVDGETGRVFGQLFIAGKRAGRQKGDWNSCIDLWIAAAAIRNDLPLATLDKGFEGIAGLRLVQADGSELVTQIESDE
jgi:predicted nucleic acid-binding protein